MTDWLGKPYYSLDAYLKKTFGEPGLHFLQCGRLR